MFSINFSIFLKNFKNFILLIFKIHQFWLAIPKIQHHFHKLPLYLLSYKDEKGFHFFESHLMLRFFPIRKVNPIEKIFAIKILYF